MVHATLVGEFHHFLVSALHKFISTKLRFTYENGTKEKRFDIEILEEIETGNKSKSDIENNYGIHKTTTTGIVKKRDEILENYHSASMSSSRKRHR